jgi:hypothetical protein
MANLTSGELQIAINHVEQGGFREAAKILRAMVANQTPMVVKPTSPVTEIDKVTMTWTTAAPSLTTDGALTIANGGTPTVLELQLWLIEVNAKLEAIGDVLAAVGLTTDA